MRTFLILLIFLAVSKLQAIESSLRMASSTFLEFSPEFAYVVNVGRGFAIGLNYHYWEKEVKGVEEIFHEIGAEAQYFFNSKTFSDSFYGILGINYQNLELRKEGGSANAGGFVLQLIGGYHFSFDRWHMYIGVGTQLNSISSMNIKTDTGEVVDVYDRLTKTQYLVDWSIACRF